MDKSSKIYIPGHNGMVGKSLCKYLSEKGFKNIIKLKKSELDLRRQKEVEDFFKSEKPNYVFLIAAKVGGINDNIMHPAQFIYDNLMIQNNVIHSSYLFNAKKLLFVGSSCIYPKNCIQPMKEEYLLSGMLEPTNEAYAIAKISGLEMCKFYKRQYGCNFISAMPTNLYGINDNFDLETSHVLPAMLRKFHEAKVNGSHEVVIWGTGTPKREFLYVDDLANALVFLMDNYNGDTHVNIGSGEDLEIRELAEMIRKIVGYSGKISYDMSKPDGMPRKLLDVSFLQGLGWRHSYSLEEGISRVYEWYTSL